MSETIYQDIFDLISDYLPAEWNKVVFYALYTSGSYTMKYYYRVGIGDYIDCFSSEIAEDREIINTFSKINNIISKERENLSINDRWNVFTMIVDATGKLSSKYDYNDYSENTIAFEQMWESKYLI